MRYFDEGPRIVSNGLPVKLHFLGTTGYHPNNLRQTACLMLPEVGIVLDAGTGIFRARSLLCTDHLDILVTHLHLDHAIGLTYLYNVLGDREMNRVTVHVAADKVDALQHHLYDPLLFPVKPNFEIRTFDSGTMDLPGDCRVRMIPLEHPGGCHGFRLDWPDRSLAYITDTMARVDAAYVDEIRGVDTLIHECYFEDGNEKMAELTGHSCLSPVVAVARKSGARRVYLVHVDPRDERDEPFDLEPHRPHFDELFVAVDGLEIDV